MPKTETPAVGDGAPKPVGGDALMSIGVFARCSGLTASALRFYADSGVLPPAEIDPLSGYRYYAADQIGRATALRRLREIAMPLAGVAAVLDAGPGDAVRLIDEYVANVVEDARAVRRKAALVKSALVELSRVESARGESAWGESARGVSARGEVSGASVGGASVGGAAGVESTLVGGPGLPIAVLKGPVLAEAIDQVMTATVREPGLPVLGGLHIEAAPGAVTLTATDRYRLSTRTLVPVETAATTWAAVVDGDELRAAAVDVRRSPLVRVEATPYALRLRMAGREDRHCRLLAEEFPDHRLMLASLPEVRVRVTVPKVAFLRMLEERVGECVSLFVSGCGRLVTDAEVQGGGLGLRVTFEVTTLYPAVSTAVGPDVMLDLRGPDQPMTIRSADRGDLTTLAMPVRSDVTRGVHV